MNSRDNRQKNNNARGSSGDRNNTATTRLHQAQSHNIPQPHAQAHAPVLAPKDQADLDAFRVALKELTFNSRPIIEKLTGMARERARTIPGPVSRTILDNLVFVNNKMIILISNPSVPFYIE